VAAAAIHRELSIMRARDSLTFAVLVLGIAARAGAADGPLPEKPSFIHDIRPLLANNCFACHGPDEAARKAELRLDTREGALAHGSAIVPGKSADSEILRRLTAADPAERMPPAETGKALTERQIELVRLWIDAGAEWDNLWSFVTPKRPAPPVADAEAAWVRNPIDQFVLARLNAEGLRPSREADPTALIRRLTLDLTGLPPTPSEVDAFLAEWDGNAAAAFDRLVERLLDSPHYGERMALDWLDAARFADTNGYHIDNGRDMTRWREWVIEAFNRNLPFDQFTIEQLAGDLLENPTLDQRIASGFNRNHMINFEGGAIPEEYHNAYIVDRVNTTGTVWLGLTIGCTQCHDHKYDPLTQREFYQLYAFFHNVPENGLDGRTGNAAPLVKAPSAEQQARLDELAAAIGELESRISAPHADVDAAQIEWASTAAATPAVAWTTLKPADLRSRDGAELQVLDDGLVLAAGPNPATDIYTIVAPLPEGGATGLRLEALPHDSLTAGGPGRSVNGNVVLTGVRVAIGDGGAAADTPVKLTAAAADFSQQGFDIATAIDGDPAGGWAIHPEVGKPHTAMFRFDQAVAARTGATITVMLEFQSQFGQHQLGHFRLATTAAEDPLQVDTLPAEVAAILALAAGTRTDEQRAALRTHYRQHVSPIVRAWNEQLASLRAEHAEADKRIPTVMVMEEMPQPRDTFVLVRGQYDKPGQRVTPGVPASLPPLPEGAPANRLGLARWLVDPQHPLTARVIVNRYWQMYFGTGLVKTSEDFGSQGELPSHPELLDWLAREFVESGWDVKHMQRLIVGSATYRQSSAVTPELASRDPENRLLARGPRHRLQAEFIRDQALAVSGLLDPRIGGGSVSPYQPSGLWEELAYREDGANWTAQSYTQSHGPDLYRRTMYTFWKRTSPPPTLSTFDAPDRETCTVRRARTNTPLQALILLNDPTYVEASRKLAERLLREGGDTVESRIDLAFRLTTARRPNDRERAVLRQVLLEQLAAFRSDPAAALALLSVGESPRDDSFEVAELAAWTTVASVLLNVDETLTKS
jgi:hypothetical protein